MRGTKDVCECNEIHPDVLEGLERAMPPESNIIDLADFFKLFGESSRLKILLALKEGKEMCVCDISSFLKMSMSAVSHQLRPLKDAKLIKSRRDGKVVFYSLDDEHVEEIITIASAHISELNR